MVNCPNCGMNLPDDGRVKDCFFCGHRMNANPDDQFNNLDQPGEGSDDQAGFGVYSPWEDQDNLGMFTGLYTTLRASMFMPRAFFRAAPVQGGYIYPLLFAMIVSTIGAMGNMVWGFIFESPIFSDARLTTGSTLLLGVALPLLIPLGVIINSVALHVSLIIVNGAKGDFQATFRVVCYSSGPDLVNLFLPAIGSGIAFGWQLIISTIGLSIVHETSVGRIILAYLVLFLITVFLVIALVLITIGIAGI